MLHRQQPVDERNFSFEEQHYQDEGVAVMVSILDCLELNPYSRIPNTEFKSLAEVRRCISREVLNMERFRIMERNGNQTINAINDLINELHFKQISERGFFRDPEKWPDCVNFARYSPPKRKYQRKSSKKRSANATAKLYEEEARELVPVEATAAQTITDEPSEFSSLTLEQKDTCREDAGGHASVRLAQYKEEKLLEELKAYEEAM